MNIQALAEYVAATTGVVELQRPYQVLLKRKELEELIASVAAHEREECAKVCESGYVKDIGIYLNLPSYYAHNHACKVFAAAIRARSNA